MELQREQPSHPQNFFRFIPEEVLKQLYFHLDTLPAHISRMVDLLVESGKRVNELCTLPFDCLLRGDAGNWFLRSIQLKTQQEYTLPLSGRVAAAIREQQQVVRDKQGSTTHVLFPNPRGVPFSQGTFMNMLNRIAREWDIRDASGKVWRFQAHPFRHAVIAQMMNDGVPLHIIQYYLNAQTLDEVVGVYKQLFGPSRKEEFIPLLAEVADRKWKCDQRRELFNWEEVSWISKNRRTKNTPVGYFPPTTYCQSMSAHLPLPYWSTLFSGVTGNNL